MERLTVINYVKLSSVQIDFLANSEVLGMDRKKANVHINQQRVSEMTTVMCKKFVLQNTWL